MMISRKNEGGAFTKRMGIGSFSFSWGGWVAAILAIPNRALAVENQAYLPTDYPGTCAYIYVHFEQRNNQLFAEALVDEGGTGQGSQSCNFALLVPQQTRVSYTLWKWNGTTSVVCGGEPGWP